MLKKRFLKRINPLYLKGIAHRGLHDDLIPENSISSFDKAIKAGFAIEFDVHLTLDMHLVVIHDEDLQRTTGRVGIVEELTLKEIKENYRLKDKSSVPTFKEVLDLCQEKVPMVIELKVYKKNYKALARRLIKELDCIKDKKNYMLISFDPRALLYARPLRLANSLLLCRAHYDIFKYRCFFDSLDIEDTMVNDPKIVKYQKKHFVNVWTIDTLLKLKEIQNKVDTFTFEKIPTDVINSRFLD